MRYLALGFQMMILSASIFFTSPVLMLVSLRCGILPIIFLATFLVTVGVTPQVCSAICCLAVPFVCSNNVLHRDEVLLAKLIPTNNALTIRDTIIFFMA